MALLANGVDLGAIEQVRTQAAMRKVARRAAFGLYRGMFIHKRPGDFRVAFRADDVFLRGRPLEIFSEGAMRFMTIRAQDYPLFHPMRGGDVECGLLVILALKA